MLWEPETHLDCSTLWYVSYLKVQDSQIVSKTVCLQTNGTVTFHNPNKLRLPMFAANKHLIETSISVAVSPRTIQFGRRLSIIRLFNP